MPAEPGLPSPTHISDYEVGTELGRGAMSVVYRARKAGVDYAIKVMGAHTKADAVDIHLQFRREAAAIARIDHPSLVRIMEVGVWENLPYLVMELAEGESLERRIARATLNDEEVRAIGRAMAEGLIEVHRFGLVHRDIKPANIIVSDSGRVRLIDFGLVTGAQEGDAIVGTLNYASPEQVGVVKRAIGAPADLYSLGATLFECLTGQPPLKSTSLDDFFHQLATVPAPELRSIRPETRPGLSAIISRLLSKDPDDRYQSARGLLHDLTQLDAIDDALQRGVTDVLCSRDATLTSDTLIPLVGRTEEVKRISQSWEKARSGAIGIVRIEGESGSGKTRLAQELISRADEQAALVLSGKCQELETVPFGPLREAADQFAARVLHMPSHKREEAITRLRAAAGPWAPLIKRLAVGLSRLIGETEDLPALEPDAEQQRYYEALASFFRNLGTSDAPLLLVVDDIQWLDEGSLRVLGRLVSDTSPAFVLVLATARNTQTYDAARARFTESVRCKNTVQVDLRALNRAAVEELIRARLGGRPLSGPVVDRLATLTRGNPFAVGEYLRALLDAGVVRPVAGAWHADLAAIDAVRLPKDVVELVLTRLHTLGQEASRLVSTAGIIGGRFTLDLVAKVSKASMETLARAIEEMVRATLVERVQGNTYAFVHDRVREASVEKLSKDERRDVHQAIAETLEQLPDLVATDIYAIARHYAEGHTERNPRRVAETNLAAGLRALEDHANEEAFEILERALAFSRESDPDAAPPMKLFEGLGRACAMTGRLNKAFEYLQEALRLAQDQHDRFRIQYLLTLSFASQGRNDEALDSLYQAFTILGRPFPRSLPAQVWVLLTSWTLALVLRWTGIGYASSKAQDRELRKVLSQLHYVGSMLALFQCNPFLMVQFIVRDYYNVHFLGVTAETAIASAVYGAVLGIFQMKSVMARYTRMGVEMAEQLGDRSALAVCRIYQAAGTKWAGDLVKGNEMMLAVLPDMNRYIPGSWYAVMALAEQSYSYLHAGLSQSAIEHVRANLAQIERSNNLMYHYNILSVQCAEMMLGGKLPEANKLWAQLETQFQPLSKTIYVRLARIIARLEILIDQEETGPEIEELAQACVGVVNEDYYSTAARMLLGYARMNQYLLARSEDRPLARKNLEKATFALSLRAMTPVFRCHPFIWKAVMARMDGKYDKARALLDKANVLASRCESHRGLFFVALERARLARETGDTSARYLAQAALDVASSENWRQKSHRVRMEFGLTEERGVSMNSTLSGASSSSMNAEKARRYADALLQVSLASASTLDGDAQAQNALSEVSRVLGAERALLFLIHPDSGELQLKAHTGAGVENVARSVIRKVLETRTPLVYTGNDQGEEIGSGSLFAHGLRSIIAAPLQLRDRLMGVVYLDSKLAKGIFTNDDVDLLQGVSNHIAIAIETARTARIEAERSSMERDLELLGVVQSLLLPKSATFSTSLIRGSSFYQPATQCGGDWWWHEELADGSLLILVGDVSGHGAAPAMITSTVAGAFHALCCLPVPLSPTEILDVLDRQVRSFGGGFHMTVALVRIDPARSEIVWWNAAGPSLFLLDERGPKVLSSRGSMLGGSSPFEVRETIVSFKPGSRLLVCTDGLLEMKQANGRDLGARKVADIFSKLSSVPIDEISSRLGSEVNRILAGNPQDDDITFVVVEMNHTPRPSPTPFH